MCRGDSAQCGLWQASTLILNVKPDEISEKGRVKRVRCLPYLGRERCSMRQSAPLDGVPPRHGLDHVDQLRSIARLVHERDGAGLQTAPAHLIAAAAGQNDGGNSMARRLRFEKIQAAHAGHLQVQYQAFHLVAVSEQCKGFGGCESLDAEPERDE